MEDDMEMEEIDYIDRSIQRRQRISAAIKSALTFLASHVGLGTMVIGYSILGGFLFEAIEAPNEVREKNRIRSIKELKIAEIRQLADLLCIRSISPENFTALVNEIQVNFQTQVFLAVKNNGWDGKEESNEATKQWSFAVSLLYAVTVITTIGYGHVAPKTTAGRLATIIYALVGIPLTFLYLSNMGNFMAECFRIFYKKVCCSMCIFCINRGNPKDEVYDRMEMAAQSNYAFHDTDDDGKVTTVYGEVDVMQRSNSKTLISSSNDREPDLEEGCRRKSRTVWNRHSISRPIRGDERERRRITPSNGTAALDAFARRGSRFQETQFTTRTTNPGGKGGGGVARTSQGRGSAETAEARYSTTPTEEETSSQKDDRSLSQKKLLSDFRKVDRLSCNKIDERNKCSDRDESSGGGFRRSDVRPLATVDKGQLTNRRHSFESAIAPTSPPLMFDKSVEVSMTQFHCRVDRDPDGLRTSSSPFNPLFEGNRSSERLGVKGHKMLTPSGESAGQLPIGRKYVSSASDVSPNSNATEASLSESKDYIPLRRLPSRSRASTSQQGLNGQSNEASWSRNRVPPEDDSKCVTEVNARNDGDDDDDDDEEEDEQQRVMFGRMMARQNRLFHSESVLNDSEVSVPISICLIIIGLYIFFGSLLFTMWEEWDYLTGSYFCFVTLSTIGFGDIVPGTDMTEWAASQKLILCSLWLVVGLSLLAMCFNLMQEEVKDKFKWLGRRCGILKDD